MSDRINNIIEPSHLIPVAKMNKDLKETGITLGGQELRTLVDKYYQMQDDRIRTKAQIREAEETKEPHEVLIHLATESERLENQIKGVLQVHVENRDIGKWLLANKGIGAVLSAGLLAHIDINIAKTAGDIWNFAGLNPSIKWEKGKKRPFNARLKTLCWKIGESFVKVSGNKDAFYGQIYADRKKFEVDRNEKGYYKEHAKKQLEEKKYSKNTDAYACYIKNILPPAHIHAISKRFTVKLFLSHFHAIWFELEHGKPAPLPYAIAILGHGHHILPPFNLSDL